jgi:hypothetical protein
MNRLRVLLRRLLVALAALAVSSVSLGAEEPKPTRKAFLGEVLDAKPTPVTPKFNDYTPGSYHIEKEDLLKGLLEEAKKRKLTLRSVTILGPLPADPLWTSYVMVCIQDGKKIRVNSLVMPHARITSKATGLITAEQYKKWREGILSHGVLKKEAPTDAKKIKSPAFRSQLLLVAWSGDGKTREVHYGDVMHGEKSEKADRLLEQYNTLLKKLKKTYPEKDK